MAAVWIHFCVLAIVTSLTYSTRHKSGGIHRQHRSSQVSTTNDNITKYIDLSISLLGQNRSQHNLILQAVAHVDRIFQRQLKTRVVLSDFQVINVTSPITAGSDSDAIRAFKQLAATSSHDSKFIIRYSSLPSVLSTFKTLCGRSFSGGVISTLATYDAWSIARQLMYGLGRNFGFPDNKYLPDSCDCNNSTGCMMSDTWDETQNPFMISITSCNIYEYNQMDSSCLRDQPTPLPGFPTCGDGIVNNEEQCDCLTGDIACRSCCVDCTFVEGAVCTSGPCCTTDCQFQMEGQTCPRCDVTSICTGKDNQCKIDDQRSPWCDSVKDECNIIGCSVRDSMCKTIVGKDATAVSTQCLNELQAENDPSSAFCTSTTHCSQEMTGCDTLICHAKNITLRIPELVRLVNVSRSTPSICSDLYAVTSLNTDVFVPTDGVMCEENGICVSETCHINQCNDKNGASCSGNGKCDVSNKCLCNCGWIGSKCNEQDTTRTCQVTGSADDDETISGVQPTHIIAVFISIIFVISIVSGATSCRYKRLQKRNRLQIKHERDMLSLFEPTKGQKQRLARKYNNKHANNDGNNRDRYRMPAETCTERMLDEGMPPPRLCTAVKYP